MLLFSKKYFLLALILIVVEISIALFVRDAFVRPYVGDYLVVMLLYCAVRSILNAPVMKVAISVLIFAYLIEILQYLHLVERLGLEDNILAKTVIGYGFDWMDILAYTLGVITILVLEKRSS